MPRTTEMLREGLLESRPASPDSQGGGGSGGGGSPGESEAASSGAAVLMMMDEAQPTTASGSWPGSLDVGDTIYFKTESCSGKSQPILT